MTDTLTPILGLKAGDQILARGEWRTIASFQQATRGTHTAYVTVTDGTMWFANRDANRPARIS